MFKRIMGSLMLACLTLSGCGDDGPPTYISKASTTVQTIKLKKEPFSEDKSYGLVTDLAVLPKSKNIALAGMNCAAYLDKDGQSISTVHYEPRTSKVSLVPSQSNPEVFEYLDRGSWSGNSCLIDSTGKVKWKAESKSGVDDTAYGVLKDNRWGRFAIGYNGSGGVSLLGEDGRELWNEEDGNVWHVEITSPANGAAKIVHSNAAGEVTVRDGYGKIESRVKAPFYFSDFSLCRFPKRTSDECVLSCSDGKLFLLDLKGTIVKSFEFPVEDPYNDSRGTLVKLNPSTADYFATITSWKNWDRSLLRIFDNKGELAYEEVLAEQCLSMAALPDIATASDVLLIGGNEKVWKYSIGSSDKKTAVK